MEICKEFLLIGGPWHLQVVGDCKEVGDRILKPIPLYANEENDEPGCTWTIEYTVMPDQIEGRYIAVLDEETRDKIITGEFNKTQKDGKDKWIWKKRFWHGYT